MDTVPSVSTQKADKYALVPSLKDAAKDRYRPFRHDDVHALVAAIQNELDGR